MKFGKYHALIFLFAIIAILSSCEIQADNMDDVQVSTNNTNNDLTTLETVIPDLTETTTSGSTSSISENISENFELEADENISADFEQYSELIEKYFLGVWKSDLGQEYIIGKNSNYELLDLMRGRIESVDLDGNIVKLFTKNYIGDKYRLEIDLNDPDIILSYYENMEMFDSEYEPEKFIRIDTAEMYSDTGKYDLYIESLLYIKYNYFHGFGTTIGPYSSDARDMLHISGFTVLEEHSENRLVFVEAFVDTTVEYPTETDIRYELIFNGDYWEIGEWETVTDYLAE